MSNIQARTLTLYLFGTPASVALCTNRHFRFIWHITFPCASALILPQSILIVCFERETQRLKVYASAHTDRRPFG